MIIFILALLTLLATSISSISSGKAVKCPGSLPSSEYFALLDIYNSTSGPSWKTTRNLWSYNLTVSNVPCTQPWNGITCICDANGNYTVNELNLNSGGLFGTIPDSIDQLSSLVSLSMNTNSLFDSIPATLGNLTSITSLDLMSNSLSGTLPMSLSRLKTAYFIHLSRNNFFGEIPDCFGNMTSLFDIDLSRNSFQGSIPTSVFNKSTLISLILNNNLLSGTLPDMIQHASTLLIADFHSNNLDGTVPAVLSKLTALQSLSLAYNHFSHTLPIQLKSLSSMQTLDISYNAFSGRIDWLPKNLQNLDLFGNSFSGIVPAVYLPTKLSKIGLGSNYFKGALPLAKRAEYLYVQDNYFSGSFPASYGTCTSLNYINISCNLFTGVFPNDVFNQSIVLSLDIHENSFTGTIPQRMSKSRELWQLNMEYNMLTGPIPTFFGVMSRLKEVILNNNMLTGSIPTSLSLMSQLFAFYGSHNRLTGTLPSYFGSYHNLNFLWLSSNHFTGVLPSQLGLAPALIEILIDHNSFSGNPLVALNSASQIDLQVVDIGDNLFSGSISSCIGNFVMLNTFVANSNCMTGTVPSTICNIKDTLVTFSIDGIGSNSHCPTNKVANEDKPFFMKGTYQGIDVEGMIPECLFQSTSLQILHASGNGLRGTLPSISANSSLIDLSISNNRLHGTIPESIQTHEFLQQLNLARNQFEGTLVPNFVVSANQTSLTLAENRLSGVLPKSIAKLSKSTDNLDTLDVLSGNIFSCQYGIPSQDKYSLSYYCESSEMNSAIATWLCLYAICASIVLLIWQIYKRGLKTLFRETCVERFVDGLMEVVGDVNRWHGMAQAIRKLGRSNYRETMGASAVEEYLVETKAFLKSIHFLRQWSVFMLLIILVTVLPSFTGMSVFFSYVTDSYGYVVSIAYLHGLAPTLLSGIIIFFCIMWSFGLISYNHKMLLEFVKGQGRQDSVNGFEREPSNFHLKIGAILMTHSIMIVLTFALHAINITVTVAVNAAYVNAILNYNDLTRWSLLTIQLLVGFFKLVWNNVYVPWASFMLSKFMSEYRVMQNRFVMAMFNYIFAPCLATLVTSQSCFYFAFKPYDTITSSTEVMVCQTFALVHQEIVCTQSVTTPIETSFRPTFMYSYTCGTALIRTYIPVFLYVYCSIGIAVPILRLVLTLYPKLKRPQTWFRKDVLVDPNSEEGMRQDLPRIKGTGIVVTTMQHITVLLTFGMACPVVGVPIAMAIVADCFVNMVMTGKYIDIATNIWEMFHFNRNKSSHDTTKSIDRSWKSVDVDNLEGELTNSWQGITACFSLLVVTVAIFWSFLFFDMIADPYDDTSGAIATVVFVVLLPIVFLLIRRVTRGESIYFNKVVAATIHVMSVEYFLYQDDIGLQSDFANVELPVAVTNAIHRQNPLNNDSIDAIDLSDDL